MPNAEFDLAPTDRVFSANDPLTITIPGAPDVDPDSADAGGTFKCCDRYSPPIEVGETDIEMRPLSYLVTALENQVMPDERPKFREALLAALTQGRIASEKLGKMLADLTKIRREAEEKAMARRVDRPTTARARSSRSSK